MQQKLTGDEPGLIAYWLFDSGDGSLALPNGQRALFKENARCVDAAQPTPADFAQPAVVRGRVRLATGDPAFGATIRLEQEGTIVSQTEAGTRGDENGAYELTLFYPNTKAYELVVVFSQRTLRRSNVRLQMARCGF